MKNILLLISFNLLFKISYAQNDKILLKTLLFDNVDRNKKYANVFQDTKTKFIYFKADFDLDADGSPWAYHPKNTGLLHNLNGGGTPPSPSVIYYTPNKFPYIQKNIDPAPGYYLSMTSLKLTSYSDSDYRKYVNPDSISYFVLPGGMLKTQNVSIGDIGLIYNLNNQKHSFAIYADSGPSKIIGEGSLKLAKNLGIPFRVNEKGRLRGGLDEGNILYIVFPSSGKGPQGYSEITNDEIDKLGRQAIQNIGSIESIIEKYKN